VQSNGVAKASEDFIQQWQENAKKCLITIITNNIDLYIGTVLPVKNIHNDSIDEILIPIGDSDGNAKIATKHLINKDDAVIMPFKMTPHNFAIVIKSLLNKPYAWGNLNFHNDCSSELQDIFAPFGIWLPRNSSSQIAYHDEVTRKVIDLSALTAKDRIKYLIENGKKFTTIIYIDGHIMLYIGNYPMAMTYQNFYAMPEDGYYRQIIGKSVFFPILEKYQENLNLTSLANKPTFKLLFLNSSVL
jgi:hypothetical protein